MKIYLVRESRREFSTDGVLRDHKGNRICDTAENTLTMLPEGCYELSFKPHPSGEYRAIGVGEYALLIHGNGVYAPDFGANILLGQYLVPGVVKHSARYFGRLVKRLEKAFHRHRHAELIIQSQ